VGLLRQNLSVEFDLQGFSGFVLERVAWLKSSPFATTPVLLGLMQKLRAAGVASGYSLPVILSLNGNHLLVSWGGQTEKVVNLTQLPPPEEAGSLLRAGASWLYYDLSAHAIIDQVYYKWLNQLSRTVSAINLKMV